MLARLYRIFAFTAVLAALALAPSCASAVEDAPATTANGYTFGGALNATANKNHSEKDENWLAGQIERFSLVGSNNDLGSMSFDQSFSSAPSYYSPRDSQSPLFLDESSGGFTPRENGMLGLVYAAEKWQLGAGYGYSPSLETGDPLKDSIDRYMLGTRYDAFGTVGFGASIELRDYDTDDPAREDDEKVFTFGTYINF